MTSKKKQGGRQRTYHGSSFLDLLSEEEKAGGAESSRVPRSRDDGENAPEELIRVEEEDLPSRRVMDARERMGLPRVPEWTREELLARRAEKLARWNSPRPRGRAYNPRQEREFLPWKQRPAAEVQGRWYCERPDVLGPSSW